jgi:hypothetical protein
MVLFDAGILIKLLSTDDLPENPASKQHKLDL